MDFTPSTFRNWGHVVGRISLASDCRRGGGLPVLCSPPNRSLAEVLCVRQDGAEEAQMLTWHAWGLSFPPEQGRASLDPGPWGELPLGEGPIRGAFVRTLFGPEALWKLKESAQDELVREPITHFLQVRETWAQRPTGGGPGEGGPFCWIQFADG